MNLAANVLRNVWTYVVIFCGHFNAGPLMAFASGNLCYQSEHHLFPDLPRNRYAEIAVRVRGLCAKFGLPYTTGSILRQYLQTLRTIHALALPDRGTRAAPGSAVPAVDGERKIIALDAVA